MCVVVGSGIAFSLGMTQATETRKGNDMDQRQTVERFCEACEGSNDLEQPVKVGRKWLHPSCANPGVDWDRYHQAMYDHACGYVN